MVNYFNNFQAFKNSTIARMYPNDEDARLFLKTISNLTAG